MEPMLTQRMQPATLQVWCNRGTSGRSTSQPLGNEQYASVATGNLLVVRALSLTA